MLLQTALATIHPEKERACHDHRLFCHGNHVGAIDVAKTTTARSSVASAFSD
jgi:hypothetical protein